MYPHDHQVEKVCVYLTTAVGTCPNPNCGNGQLLGQGLSDNGRQALQKQPASCSACTMWQSLIA